MGIGFWDHLTFGEVATRWTADAAEFSRSEILQELWTSMVRGDFERDDGTSLVGLSLPGDDDPSREAWQFFGRREILEALGAPYRYKTQDGDIAVKIEGVVTLKGGVEFSTAVLELPWSEAKERVPWPAIAEVPIERYDSDFVRAYIEALRVSFEVFSHWCHSRQQKPPGFWRGPLKRNLAGDPFVDPYWNTMQVLAWAWTYDKAIVRRASDNGAYWPEPTKETPPRPMTTVALSLWKEWPATKGGPLGDLDYGDLVDAILATLRSGRLRATGLKNARGERSDIDPVHWCDLELHEGDKYGPWEVYAGPLRTTWGSETLWTRLRFKRSEVLGIWPDPLENLPSIRTPLPLLPLEDAALDYKLKLDSWTLTEALFILHGYKPPGFETSDELMSHFPDAYNLAVNSILSGTFCREILVAGERQFIESPARWFGWALEKGLPVADAVRAKMTAEEETHEGVAADNDITPMAVLLEEEPEVRDWFQAPTHTLEDCICYLMKKHRKLVTNRGDGHEDFDRFKILALGSIHGGKLRAKYVDGVHWIERQNFIAWARKIDLGVFRQNLDELEACKEPVEAIDPYHTGLPGRPKASHFAIKELERRASLGTLETSLAAQARVIRDWLQSEHPDAPPIGQRALENALRDRYWKLKRGSGPNNIK